MATLKIQDALDKAKQNPNSDFASFIRKEIESGNMDAPAQQQGVDLSPFGRPSLDTLRNQGGFLKEGIEDIKGIGRGIKESTNRRLDNFDTIDSAQDSGEQGLVSSLAQKFGQGAAFAGDVVGETVIGAGKALLPQDAEDNVAQYFQAVTGDAIEAINDPENTSPGSLLFKKYKELKTTNPELARNIDAATNTIMLGLDVSGVGIGAKGVKQVSKSGTKLAVDTIDSAGNKIKNTTAGAKQIAGDVIPTKERLTEFQITRALDLTQGDVKNIASSTKNEVGDFMAKQNLIGDTKDATQKLVDDFFETNFKQVRDEIGKVDTSYTLTDIPRGKQALDALKKQVNDVVGLEDVNNEVSNLLNKKSLTLNDAQRIKELLDDQFDLFKVTGDVKDSTVKKGLSQVRDDLKKFIEDEVEGATGANIRVLNNNVATSKSITDAITTRSTRGLTKGTVKLGDLGIFGLGSALGGPLVGAALVVGKKILESAPIRLRMAKYLDGISDAQQAKLIKELEAGKVPKEINDVVNTTKTEIPNREGGFIKIPGMKKPSKAKFVDYTSFGDRELQQELAKRGIFDTDNWGTREMISELNKLDLNSR